MPSPSEPINVRCPQCRNEYRDRSHTPHVLEEDGIECPESSVCPACGCHVPFGELVVRPGGHWVVDRPIEQAWLDD